MLYYFLKEPCLVSAQIRRAAAPEHVVLKPANAFNIPAIIILRLSLTLTSPLMP